MSDEHSLLRPLRNDSLKPRPSTQAVWEPAAPLHIDEAPDLPAFTPSKTVSWESAPLQPDGSAPEAPQEPTATGEPEALPQADSSLSDIIASILAGDEDDDEDVSASHDAFPSKNMPEPACVPLYEEPAPRRKKRSWLWLLLLMLLAGGLYAAWHFGYVTINFVH